MLSTFFGQPQKKPRIEAISENSDDTSEIIYQPNDLCSLRAVNNGLLVTASTSTAGSNQNVSSSTSSSPPNNPQNLNVHDVAGSDNFQQIQPKSSFGSTSVSSDIGHFLGQNIDEHTKSNLIRNPWQPPESYIFPHSTRTVAGKDVRNFVRHSHLHAYKEWLILSDVRKGLFCKYCPWFTNRNEGGYHKNVPLKALVTEPLTNFKDLIGAKGHLEQHARNHYHMDAVAKGKNFLKAYDNPSSEIVNLVNKQHLNQAEENRKRLIPIVKTVILLGRQNIPFRGHRDDGPLTADAPICNEGNFRAMLRFRVDAGDKELENHLQSASNRATYISKTVQNEIISCCGLDILDTILSRVRSSGFYAIIFDETSDASNKSQISLVLRYVHFDSHTVIREDFVSFIDAFGDMSEAAALEEEVDTMKASEELSLTGKSLGQIVIRKMKALQLLPLQCVAIGTDCCSVMLSEERGAVKEVQSWATHAVETPCYNHKLNNSLSQSSKIHAVENAVGVMKEVISFFSFPKRSTALLQFLGTKLSHLSDTRWVERHDGVLQFTVDLPEIIEALEKISGWRDKFVAGKAASLIAALCDSQFLFAVFCLSDVLAFTLPLSKLLQKESLDLQHASESIKNVLSVLESRRADADTYFKGVSVQVENIASKLNIELRKPRTVGRQVHRSNYPLQSKSMEDYYRVSVFIPLLDNILLDLKTRFSSKVLDIFQLPILLPKVIVNSTLEEINDSAQSLVNKFCTFLEGTKDLQLMKLKGEMFHWQQVWKSERTRNADLPKTALDALVRCDKDTHKIIHTLLHILCTLPVSNASSERTFSTLRRTKTWLRTTMTESRLEGLALLHVHYDVPVNPHHVIDRFSKSNKRRLIL